MHFECIYCVLFHALFDFVVAYDKSVVSTWMKDEENLILVKGRIFTNLIISYTLCDY